MRNLLLAILLVIFLVLTGGCQSQPFSNSVEPADNSHLEEEQIGAIEGQEEQINTTEELELEGFSDAVPVDIQEQYTVTDSDKIDGWQELKAKVLLYEMTHYGDRRGSQQMEGDEMVEYSIHFPGNWTLYHGVFYDGPSKKKVAEISPVVLLKPGEKTDFLDFRIPAQETNVELLSKERITSHKYEGVRVILQVTGNEKWYLL